VERTGIDPASIEDVILGCVSQGGEQGFHIGRNAVLASKLPDSVPAVSIDRQCGSSQQAIQFAAQAVMSGTQDVVIAAGVESMTRVPMGSTWSLHAKEGLGVGPFSTRIQDRYGVESFSQFTGAEMMAEKYGFSREELDAFALASHKNAAAATSTAIPGCIRRTKASAAMRRWSRSVRCVSSKKTARFPPRTRVRSATARRACSS
jgi:acetyl-CoA C-acetyltransferase